MTPSQLQPPIDPSELQRRVESLESLETVVPPSHAAAPRALRSQLAAGFMALLGMMLVVVLLSAWHLRSIQDAADRVAGQEWSRLLALQDLATHAHGHGAAMARLLTAPRGQRETIYPSLDAESAAMDKLISQLEQQIIEPEALALVAEMDASRLSYREVFGDVGMWIEAGEPDRAAALFSEKGQPALDGLISLAEKLAQTQQRAVAAWQQQAASRVEEAEQQLIFITLLALIAAAALAWGIARGVTQPMARLADTARLLAEGDLMARVDTRSDSGPREVQRVGEALNAMAEAIGERNRRIEVIAFTDPVTGLPNRAGLLREAMGMTHRPDTVLLCNVARLAAVNDVLGPAAGDALLCTIGRRLQEVARPLGWHTGHLGAGTFALLWRHGSAGEDPGIDSRQATVLSVLSMPILCGDVSIEAQFRCGWSRMQTSDDDRPNLARTLLEAEEALGDAKRLRADTRCFERVDPGQRRRQLVLLGSLRDAALQGGLQMWLQPKVTVDNSETPRCSGFEALVRWKHPEWGMVSPAEFVPFAEAAGMIHLITRCMIEQALEVLGRPEVQRLGVQISVNVSTADLLDEDFCSWLCEKARKLGAPLDRLTLEITEGRLMDHAERAMPTMNELRAAGVKWSIDDFGTGYSSLAYLQRLPVSELKVDRSFVDQVDASPARLTLLRSIVQLGRGLGLQVTAEGVERPQEWAELIQAGCDLAQGWLVARPMPADAALAWLAQREVAQSDETDRRLAAPLSRTLA